MSSKSKQKGYRFESEFTKKLNENGIPAVRVPMSGSLGGVLKDDVIIGSIEHPIARCELKYRENLSVQLWEWLEGADYLCIKRNHKKPLVVMELDQFMELFKSN